jgi:hypothetical protein
VFHHDHRHQSSLARQQAVHACYHSLLTFIDHRPGPGPETAARPEKATRIPPKIPTANAAPLPLNEQHQNKRIGSSRLLEACVRAARPPPCTADLARHVSGRDGSSCSAASTLLFPRLNARKSKASGWNAGEGAGEKSKSFSCAPSSARTGQESAAREGKAARARAKSPSPSDDTLNIRWQYTTQL